ncbi:hypothetical protein K7X08_007054 [Anisodus acutangulus]|uniref:Uncharacterized protein n=1 Tax=Anisodus acutangulus TaxID=402998 RepID=A0A9Q1LBX4_9SOLA|nr:hypothetical protein K7X08_007054 [Anisodus acutangulus]
MFGEKKRKERRDAKSGARLQTGSMALSAHRSVTFLHSSFTKHKVSNLTVVLLPRDPYTLWQRQSNTQIPKSNHFSQIPLRLPENVVPEAYREWEVKVFDWQTQCPTLAHDDAAFSFMYKFIRLLPTVGCEADAATRYTIDERNITDDNVSTFAYQATGCYVAAWSNNNNENTWELEHCLIDPQEKESRVRIVQVVRLEDSKLVLKSIKMFCEHWYGPFRNGDQLGGCAI